MLWGWLMLSLWQTEMHAMNWCTSIIPLVPKFTSRFDSTSNPSWGRAQQRSGSKLEPWRAASLMRGRERQRACHNPVSRHSPSPPGTSAPKVEGCQPHHPRDLGRVLIVHLFHRAPAVHLEHLDTARPLIRHLIAAPVTRVVRAGEAAAAATAAAARTRSIQPRLVWAAPAAAAADAAAAAAEGPAAASLWNSAA